MITEADVNDLSQEFVDAMMREMNTWAPLDGSQACMDAAASYCAAPI